MKFLRFFATSFLPVFVAEARPRYVRDSLTVSEEMGSKSQPHVASSSLILPAEHTTGRHNKIIGVCIQDVSLEAPH